VRYWEFREAEEKKIVAVMPGGFHPFHPGHKSLYDWAVETFGAGNVYVAATNDTSTRPFPFDIKQKLAGMAGVPSDKFIQVKSPFNALSYSDIIGNPSNTNLIFIRSEKDKGSHPLPDQIRKSDGMMGYLVSYKGKDQLETADAHAHMAYGPTIDFDFAGMSIKSATELRNTWPTMSEEDKHKAAELMYGNGHNEAVMLLDKALGAPLGESLAENISVADFPNTAEDILSAYDLKFSPKDKTALDRAHRVLRSRKDLRLKAYELYDKLGQGFGSQAYDAISNVIQQKKAQLRNAAKQEIERQGLTGADALHSEPSQKRIQADNLLDSILSHAMAITGLAGATMRGNNARLKSDPQYKEYDFNILVPRDRELLAQSPYGQKNNVESVHEEEKPFDPITLQRILKFADDRDRYNTGTSDAVMSTKGTNELIAKARAQAKRERISNTQAHAHSKDGVHSQGFKKVKFDPVEWDPDSYTKVDLGGGRKDAGQ
jgi:hypothetical protein